MVGPAHRTRARQVGADGRGAEVGHEPNGEARVGRGTEPRGWPWGRHVRPGPRARLDPRLRRDTGGATGRGAGVGLGLNGGSVRARGEFWGRPARQDRIRGRARARGARRWWANAEEALGSARGAEFRIRPSPGSGAGPRAGPGTGPGA